MPEINPEELGSQKSEEELMDSFLNTPEKVELREKIKYTLEEIKAAIEITQKEEHKNNARIAQIGTELDTILNNLMRAQNLAERGDERAFEIFNDYNEIFQETRRKLVLIFLDSEQQEPAAESENQEITPPLTEAEFKNIAEMETERTQLESIIDVLRARVEALKSKLENSDWLEIVNLWLDTLSKRSFFVKEADTLEKLRKERDHLEEITVDIKDLEKSVERKLAETEKTDLDLSAEKDQAPESQPPVEEVPIVELAPQPDAPEQETSAPEVFAKKEAPENVPFAPAE